MCQLFTSTHSSCLARYQKILIVGSFWYEYLLDFTCHTMKFHNCCYANPPSAWLLPRCGRNHTTLWAQAREWRVWITYAINRTSLLRRCVLLSCGTTLIGHLECWSLMEGHVLMTDRGDFFFVFFLNIGPRGPWREAKLIYVDYNIRWGKAMIRILKLTVSSQCWSQGIMCSSITKICPRSRYFLVCTNRWTPKKRHLWVVLICIHI